MEANASATFSEAELRARDPSEFERLQREHLIRRSAAGVQDSLAGLSGRLLTVVPDPSGLLECVDEDDIEFDPVPYEPQNLDWRLDIEALSARFRDANGLTGPHGWLTERLYLLGETAPDRAVVLGFVSGARSGMPLLKALPALAPARYAQFLVVCPQSAPTASELQALDSIGISVATMYDETSFLLPAWPRDNTRAVETKVDFDYSSDYRWVNLRGIDFYPTEQQALVVRILHNAWLDKRPDVSWPRIAVQLSRQIGLDEPQVGPAKMSDVFKSEPNWQVLIVSPRRGVYRLNI